MILDLFIFFSCFCKFSIQLLLFLLNTSLDSLFNLFFLFSRSSCSSCLRLLNHLSLLLWWWLGVLSFFNFIVRITFIKNLFRLLYYLGVSIIRLLRRVLLDMMAAFINLLLGRWISIVTLLFKLLKFSNRASCLILHVSSRVISGILSSISIVLSCRVCATLGWELLVLISVLFCMRSSVWTLFRSHISFVTSALALSFREERFLLYWCIPWGLTLSYLCRISWGRSRLWWLMNWFSLSFFLVSLRLSFSSILLGVVVVLFLCYWCLNIGSLPLQELLLWFVILITSELRSLMESRLRLNRLVWYSQVLSQQLIEGFRFARGEGQLIKIRWLLLESRFFYVSLLCIRRVLWIVMIKGFLEFVNLRGPDNFIWNILLIALPDRLLRPIVEGLFMWSYLEGFSGRGIRLLRFEISSELWAWILSETRNRAFIHVIIVYPKVFLRRRLLQALLLVKTLIWLMVKIKSFLLEVALVQKRILGLEGFGCLLIWYNARRKWFVIELFYFFEHGLIVIEILIHLSNVKLLSLRSWVVWKLLLRKVRRIQTLGLERELLFWI